MSEGRFLTLAHLRPENIILAQPGPVQELQNDRSQSFVGQTSSIFLCGQYNMMLRVCLGTFNALIRCVSLSFQQV